VLDHRYGGERRHLHARGEHDRLGAAQVELAGQIHEIHRVERADGAVVRHTEADGVDDGDSEVGQVVDHPHRERLGIRGDEGDPAGTDTLDTGGERAGAGDERGPSVG
jgi:hypothetical protein